MQYKYNVKLNCRSSSEGGGRRLEEKEKEQVAKQKVGSGVSHGGDHGSDQRGTGEGRLEICHDRRSCKFFSSCVNFFQKQCISLQN